MTSYAKAVLDDSPRAFYRFNETAGTTAVDTSGFGRHATHTNAPTIAYSSLLAGDRDRGFCVDYDGTNDHTVIPFGSWMQSSTFSAEAWVVPDVITGDKSIIQQSKWDVASGASGRSWHMIIQAGKVNFGLAFTDGTSHDTGEGPALTVGNLYHIVVTWDGTTARQYVNGVETWSSIAYSGKTLRSATTDMVIGADSLKTQGYFNGRVDEIAYYPTAISAERVRTHYAYGMIDWDYISESFYKEAMASGPVAFYRMAETSGTTMIDAVRARNGTYATGVTVNQSSLVPNDSTAKSALFDGTGNGYADIPNAEWMNVRSVTVQAKIKRAAGTSGTRNIVDRDQSSQGRCWKLYVSGDGLTADFWTVASGLRTISVSSVTAAGVNHDVAWTYNAGTGTARLFVDGRRVAEQTGTASPLVSGTTPLAIGGSRGGSTVSVPAFDFFSGQISEVRIFDYALADRDVTASNNQSRYTSWTAGVTLDRPAALYRMNDYKEAILSDAPYAYYRLGEPSGTTMTDSSGFGRNGTYVNSPTRGAAGLLVNDAGTAVSFSGSGTEPYATAPHDSSVHDGQSAITTEALIRPTSVSGARTIASIYDSGGGGNSWIFRVNAGKLELLIVNAANSQVICAGATTLAINTTYHVAGTYDGSNIRVYVNGVQDGITAQTGLIRTSTSTFRVAARRSSTTTDYFAGTLDEIAVYPIALAPEKIAAHATMSTSTSLIDATGNNRHGTMFNGPTRVAGLVAREAGNAALDFDGTNDYVDVDVSSGWAPPNNEDFTVEAIINADSFTSYRGIVTQDSSGTRGWNFYALNGQLHIFQSSAILTGATTMSTGVDYHVAATYTASDQKWRVYLNGVLDGTSIASSKINGQDIITIGASYAGMGSPTFFFDGRIDEVGIYNRALNARRIAARADRRFATAQSESFVINSAKISGSTSQFPVKINLADMNASMHNAAVTHGSDALRLTQGGVPVPFDLHNYASSIGTAFAKLPALISGSNADLQLEVLSSGPTLPITSPLARNGVWSDYDGVYIGSTTNRQGDATRDLVAMGTVSIDSLGRFDHGARAGGYRADNLPKRANWTMASSARMTEPSTVNNCTILSYTVEGSANNADRATLTLENGDRPAIWHESLYLYGAAAGHANTLHSCRIHGNYNSAVTRKIYVEGALGGSATTTVTKPTAGAGDASLYIGVDDGSNSSDTIFYGTTAQVYIRDGELSPVWVAMETNSWEAPSAFHTIGSGIPPTVGSADLSGGGALTAQGDIYLQTGTASLSGSGLLEGDGRVLLEEHVRDADLTGSGTLSATGEFYALSGVANIFSTGTLSATGEIYAYSGVAELSGSGTLSASGYTTADGVASLSGSGTLAFVPRPKPTFIARSRVLHTSSGTSTQTLAVQAGVAVGDLQVLSVTTHPERTAPTTSAAGFTLLGSYRMLNSRITFFTRTLDAGNVASTVPVIATDRASSELRTYRGVSKFQVLGHGSGKVSPVRNAVDGLLVRYVSTGAAGGSSTGNKTLLADPALQNIGESSAVFVWYEGQAVGDEPIPAGSDAPARTATSTDGTSTAMTPQWVDLLLVPPVTETPLGATQNVFVMLHPNGTAARVAWDQDADADSYEIELDNGTTLTTTGTSIVFNSLPTGVARTVRVRSVNAFGNGAWSTPVAFTPVFEELGSAILADIPVIYHRMQEASGRVMYDDSGNNLHGWYRDGVLVNDTIDPASPTRTGRHVRLDGGRGHLELNTSNWFWPGTNGFTFETWWYPRAQDDGAGILEFSDAGGTNYIRIWFNGTTGIYFESWWNGVGKSQNITRPSNAFLGTSWHHMAVTVSSTGVLTFWHDGTSWVSGTVGAPQNTTPLTIKYIGRPNVEPNPYWDTSLNHLAIFPTVLSAARIQDHYRWGIIDQLVPGTAALSGSGELTGLGGAVIYGTSEPAEVIVEAGEGYGDAAVVDDSIDFNTYDPSGYRYFVFDILTDELLAEIPINDVTFSHRMAGVGEFSGSIPVGALKEEYGIDIDTYNATRPMKTALYVLRGKRPVWGGIIWSRQYNLENQTLQINAGTWESYLFRRYIWHTYKTRDDVDKFEVVRQIISKMRRDFAYDYDAYDNIIPVPEISRAIDIFVDGKMHGKTQNQMVFSRGDMKSFGEVLTEYANNLDGFEWYFFYEYNERAMRFRRRINLLPTPPALLPKGSDDPPYDEEHRPGIDTYAFEYPGNIATIELAEDSDNAGTRQFVIGGFSSSINTTLKPIGSWNNNQALYVEGYPLVESVEASNHNTTSNMTTLNNLSAMYGRDAHPPVRNWTFTVMGNMDPMVGTYRVGHWCRVLIDDPFVSQALASSTDYDPENGMIKRIMGYSVTVPNGPQFPELVTLELEDDPQVSFELTEAQAEGSPDDERGPFYYGTYLPTAASTGVPENTGLTAYNSVSTNTVTLKSGQVIQDKIIYGDVKIEANASKKVVLRRCRLVGGDHNPTTITPMVDVTTPGGPLVGPKLEMYDCEVIPRNPHKNRDGIRGKRFWSIRSHISKVVQGIIIDPGSTSFTRLGVQIQGNLIEWLNRVDGRKNHTVLHLGGIDLGAKGNYFSGNAEEHSGQYTGPVDFQVTQEMADETVLIQDNGAGCDESVVYESNFVRGGLAEVYIDASVDQVVWGDNKHFEIVADSGDSTHPGYWIRVESRSTDVLGLEPGSGYDETNYWQDGTNRGTPLMEPRQNGIHFDGP